ADVEQDGSSNILGAHNQDWHLNQIGDSNTATVDQTGNYNRVGVAHNVGEYDDGVPLGQLPAGTIWGRNYGIDQAGNSNIFTVDQDGDRNSVSVAKQSTAAGAAGNTLVIIQDGIA